MSDDKLDLIVACCMIVFVIVVGLFMKNIGDYAIWKYLCNM